MSFDPYSDEAMAQKAAAEVAKRSAMHIAAALIHGNEGERDRSHDAAVDIENEVGGFIALVKRSITMLGQDAEKVWASHSEPDKAQPNLDGLRFALVSHIAGAYVSGNDDQVYRAKELEKALDRAGFNVDRQVDSLVLEALRTPPSRRGAGGRVDDCPF